MLRLRGDDFGVLTVDVFSGPDNVHARGVGPSPA